ncbi:MAG: M48 family metalloprotease [Gammaproteobacteria bacterium]|nr:M48 family metalloprotease [Gammaproteobacteria bacterium]
MDFFTSQEASRRRTRRLLMIFALACVLIMLAVVMVVAALFAAADGTLGWLLEDPPAWIRTNASLVIVTALITLAIIGLSSAYRSARLSTGGGDIARALGGTEIAHDTTDPLRLRLRNVVEEMAIASGVPVPETFVLENEGGINAFAAGFAPGDAAVAVTRGCLEQLNREELQGVVAHEFSHILNGDMRLNIRLMGVLFGILVIGMLGRMLLHGGRFGAVRVRTGRSGSSGGGGAALILVGGLALVVIGSIGVLFGRLIRAGVSRQREFLADASAVQFTRSNQGIAGALKKIGGLTEGSHLTATDTEEVGHMLFARGNRAYRNLFATHPPLEQRLAALGVSATAAAGAGARQASAAMSDDTPVSGFAAGGVSAQVGQFDAGHVAYAGALRERLPTGLADAAHSRESAPLLLLALLMHRSAAIRARQLAMLAGQLGEARCRRVESLAELVAQQGRAMRLPLLEMAFVSFKERPDGELRFYQGLARRLADASGEVELFEYCLLKLMELYLEQARAPSRAQAARVGAQAGRRAVADLLLIIAQKGGNDAQTSEQAYRAGVAAFREALGRAPDLPDYMPVSDWQPRLDAALLAAAGLPEAIRRATVTALACVITHNNHVSVAELELLRVVCAALECPLPPQLPRAGSEQVT